MVLLPARCNSFCTSLAFSPPCALLHFNDLCSLHFVMQASSQWRPAHPLDAPPSRSISRPVSSVNIGQLINLDSPPGSDTEEDNVNSNAAEERAGAGAGVSGRGGPGPSRFSQGQQAQQTQQQGGTAGAAGGGEESVEACVDSIVNDLVEMVVREQEGGDNQGSGAGAVTTAVTTGGSQQLPPLPPGHSRHHSENFSKPQPVRGLRYGGSAVDELLLGGGVGGDTQPSDAAAVQPLTVTDGGESVTENASQSQLSPQRCTPCTCEVHGGGVDLSAREDLVDALFSLLLVPLLPVTSLWHAAFLLQTWLGGDSRSGGDQAPRGGGRGVGGAPDGAASGTATPIGGAVLDAGSVGGGSGSEASAPPRPWACAVSGPQGEALGAAVTGAASGAMEQLSGIWAEAFFPLMCSEWSAAYQVCVCVTVCVCVWWWGGACL